MSCHHTGLSEDLWPTKLLGYKLCNACGYHKLAWAELAVFVFWCERPVRHAGIQVQFH